MKSGSRWPKSQTSRWINKCSTGPCWWQLHPPPNTHTHTHTVCICSSEICFTRLHLFFNVISQHDDNAVADKGALQESWSCLLWCGQHSNQGRRHWWTRQILWCGGCSHWNVGGFLFFLMDLLWVFRTNKNVLLGRFRTRKAMGGSMTFKKALTERLSIIRCSREQVNKLITDHPPQLTPGVRWINVEITDLFR